MARRHRQAGAASASRSGTITAPHTHMSSVMGDALERCHVGGRREPVNGWFHFAGALLACVGLMPLIRVANERGSIRHLVGASVFGATSLLMFSASALYHLRPASPRQRLYQRLDHAMIYLLIAGTYTPVCLITLWPGRIGVGLLIAVWALAAIGMLLDLIGRPLRRGQATAFYLAMGWAVLPVAPALREHPRLGTWLLIGGIFYTS